MRQYIWAFEPRRPILLIIIAPFKSSRKQVRVMKTPLYSKTGVYRGIHYCLIFAPKHRLWVLVPTINVLSKNKKNSQTFSNEIVIFFGHENDRCMLYGRVFVMCSTRCRVLNVH